MEKNKSYALHVTSFPTFSRRNNGTWTQIEHGHKYKHFDTQIKLTLYLKKIKNKKLALHNRVLVLPTTVIVGINVHFPYHCQCRH